LRNVEEAYHILN